MSAECQDCKHPERPIAITKIIEFTYQGCQGEIIAKESLCLKCDKRRIYSTQEVKIRFKDKKETKKKGFFS